MFARAEYKVAYQDFLLDEQDSGIGFEIDTLGALDDLETLDRHVLLVCQTQSDCVEHDCCVYAGSKTDMDFIKNMDFPDPLSLPTLGLSIVHHALITNLRPYSSTTPIFTMRH
jgi:hypothetical protein